jgi:hypothetical protein
MQTTLDKYIPFEKVSDADVIKAQLFNECRLGESGCWLWMGTKRSGYGLFNIGSKSKSAHRVAYEIFIGPIPAGLHLLHSCDTPACINPAHLRPGTVQENVDDREARRRRCVQGEQIGTCKLVAEQVREILKSDLGCTALGKKYGVSAHCIWTIKKGKAWKHLGEEHLNGR